MSPFPGYEYYRPHDETVRALTVHGDRLEREVVIPDDEFARRNAEELRSLRERARRLFESRPDAGDQLAAFLASQEAEYAYLDESTAEALWLLRRA